MPEIKDIYMWDTRNNGCCFSTYIYIYIYISLRRYRYIKIFVITYVYIAHCCMHLIIMLEELCEGYIIYIMGFVAYRPYISIAVTLHNRTLAYHYSDSPPHPLINPPPHRLYVLLCYNLELSKLHFIRKFHFFLYECGDY